MNNDDDILPIATRRSGRVTETQRSHSVHPSRTQDEFNEKVAHETAPAPWENVANTYTPPARPGMVQRWVRIEESAGVADVRNVNRKTLDGWTPRPADTVPEAFRPQSINKGQYAGYICVGDLVLMERDIETHQRQAAYNRKKIERMQSAVRSDLHRVERPGAPIEYGERSSAKIGEDSSKD
jgi:hypothetical protein